MMCFLVVLQDAGKPSEDNEITDIKLSQLFCICTWIITAIYQIPTKNVIVALM